jgi:hypothetical protein
MKPTKVCRNCGDVFTYDQLKKDKTRQDGVTNLCKSCSNARARGYRQQHPEAREKAREYSREYYKIHREEIREKSKTWRKANREYLIEAAKKWNRKNPEKHAKHSRDYHKNHPDRVLKQKQQYRENNRNRVYLLRHKREARKRGLPDTLSTEQWEICLRYFNFRCAYCGCKSDTFHRDHFIPLASSHCTGTVVTNIVPACVSCNCSKNSSDPIVWINSMFDLDTSKKILNKIYIYFSMMEKEKC